MSNDETTVVFTANGKDYEVDMGSLMVSESIVLRKHTGYNRTEWYEAMAREEPESAQFLVWLGMTRAGEAAGRIADIDFDLLALNIRDKVAPEDRVKDNDENPTGSPESDEA